MKCPSCEQDNNPNTKLCKKCGRDLTLPPAWFPDWKWHIKALAGIYVVLIICFFVAKIIMKKLPEPYRAKPTPSEMTPWLNPNSNKTN
jgi:hypothetical protein